MRILKYAIYPEIKEELKLEKGDIIFSTNEYRGVMIHLTSIREIKKVISNIHFANEGDQYEKKYWLLLKERFPNCEIFWRNFIVPLTKRILPPSQVKNEDRIRFREGISEHLKKIASFHYTVFLNLVFSYDHLMNFGLSSFEDFYTHLGSACDLAEEFLLKTYLLILECTDQKSEILQELKKEDFLKLAEKWYNDNYSNVYENYLKKGKAVPIRLLNRGNVLDEYFKDSEDWKEYIRHTQKIREYRNIIVHDVQIGRIISLGGIPLVPKKEKIQNYKKWSYVFAVQQDVQKLKGDFINMKEQMILDIGSLEVILNDLWTKPINDLSKLFFDDKNKILLKKYNIDLT